MTQEVNSFLIKESISLNYTSRLPYKNNLYGLNEPLYKLSDKRIISSKTLVGPALLELMDKNITKLDITFNKLTKEDVHILNSFKMLKELNLEIYSGLENLNDLENSPILESVYLKIHTPPSKPLSFKYLKELSVEFVCDASLDELIKNTKNLTLLELSSFYNNNIIIDGIGQFQHLKDLYLSGKMVLNKTVILPELNFAVLEDSGSGNIFKSLAQSPNLNSLHISAMNETDISLIKELLPVALKVDMLDIPKTSLKTEDYETLLQFENITWLTIPIGKRAIPFETLKKLLNLPKLETFYNGQPISPRELKRLTKKERMLFLNEDP